MRIPKSTIQLSPLHPSLLLAFKQEASVQAPVILTDTGVLVDGYRRFQIQPGGDIEAVRMDIQDVFAAARALNQRTRAWDEVDCFLWLRWASALGAEPELPIVRFASELDAADETLLRLIASRTLTLRQAALVLQTPAAYRPFFQQFLSSEVHLNNNDTASFVAMCIDLKRLLKVDHIEDVVERAEAGRKTAGPRERGAALLKAMRVMRYPYYQKKLSDFSSNWQDLNFSNEIQTDPGRFLERGKLEITCTSRSFQEMKDCFTKLNRSLESPAWRKIWEE